MDKVVLLKKIIRKLESKKHRDKHYYFLVAEMLNFLLDIVDESCFEGNLKEFIPEKPGFINPNYKELYKDSKLKYKKLTSMIDVTKLKPCKIDYIRNFQLKCAAFFNEMATFFEKNGIEYFLMGGSLIGALRHKGFVPWDDDIDIGMMRQDYERLKKILKNNYAGVDAFKLALSKKNQDKEVNKVLKKNKGKLVYYIGPKYIQIYRGTSLKDCVWFDIFPHEYYRDDYTIEEFNKLAAEMNSKYISTDNYGEILEYFDSVRKNSKDIVEKSNKIYYGIDDFTTYTIIHKQFMTQDMIFPIQKADFEGYKFCVPNKPDEYVKIEYPSYMGLPSKLEIAPDLNYHLGK